LVEAAYLEGSVILADELEGTLEIPGPGALLSVDRRDERGHTDVPVNEQRAAWGPSSDAPAGAVSDSLAARATVGGDALFRWSESLKVERQTGTMTMRGGVRLIHVSTDGSEQTELESSELVAKVDEAPQSDDLSAAAQKKVRARRSFTSATATGSVWLRRGGKEITADSLDYNAAKRTVTASALEGNAVMMLDPARPTPVSAQVLFWDMAQDRIEIRRPATIVVPK
jgi:hypothetical protein